MKFAHRTISQNASPSLNDAYLYNVNSVSVISLTEHNSGTIREMCVWEVSNRKCAGKYGWILICALRVMNVIVLCCPSATVDICVLDVFNKPLLRF
jgi:hypothetical protein